MSGQRPLAPPSHAWYAAYGSNCDGQRLSAYLAGGRLPATGVEHPGSADPAPPAADVPWHFDRPLRFAGHSRAWGGAPAFLGEGHGRALGRAWLLSWRQLEDTYAQENHCGHRPLTVDDAVHGAVITDGRYGRLLHVGELDGRPVVTFTAPHPDRLAPAPPSAAYLQVIARGLRAAHPLSADELTDRLREAAGVADGWDRPALRQLVATAS